MRKDLVITERIDRNGTKHQEIETDCPRCGGQGTADKWRHTGKVCYQCHGAARVRAKRKVYTPEHQAKLDAKQAERDANKEAERQAKWEAETPEREATTRKQLAALGYTSESIHVVIGNTYEIKEELKAEGARFDRRLRSWFFNEKPANRETYELNVDTLVEVYGSGNVGIRNDAEAMEHILIQQKAAGVPLY